VCRANSIIAVGLAAGLPSCQPHEGPANTVAHSQPCFGAPVTPVANITSSLQCADDLVLPDPCVDANGVQEPVLGGGDGEAGDGEGKAALS
jgi:hypothetical protein